MKTRALGIFAIGVAAGLTLGCMGKRRAGSQDKAKAQAKVAVEVPEGGRPATEAEIANAAEAKRAASRESAEAKGIAKIDKSKLGAKGDQPKRVLAPEAAAKEAAAKDLPELKNGDVVFQKAQKKWDQAVALATGDEWTHTGVIIWTEGEPHVIEVTKSLWQEPFRKWRKRGHGHVVVKRLKDVDKKITEENERDFKLSAVRLRTHQYDYGFEAGIERLYSAELVEEMFKTVGVTLGKRTAMKDLQKDATAAAKIEELYGEKIPPDRQILSIQSIFDDPQLETIFDSAPAKPAAAGG